MEAATGSEAASGKRITGVALVVVAGTFWSIGGIVVRLIEDAHAWHLVFYRSLTLALTFTLVMVYRQRGAWWNAVYAAGVMAVGAGLCLSVGFICWMFALTHTTVANALFLLATQPFITAILARVMLGEPILRITWLTMSLAIIGIGVMVSEGLVLGAQFGNLMALGAALSVSGFTVALRRGKEVDMLPATWWGGCFATLMAAGMLWSDGYAFGVSSWDLGMCTILGVVQIGCGLMAFTAGSRYLPASELALLSLTEVILGPLWVWLGVGEAPGYQTLIGGIIVLAAVVWRAGYEVGKPTS